MGQCKVCGEVVEHYKITDGVCNVCLETKIEESEKVIEEVYTKNDYTTSIFIASLISFLGWIAVIIGIVLVVISIGDMVRRGSISWEIIFVIAPSLGVFVTGFFLIIVGQTARAVFDNTNYSKQMLYEMKRNR